MGLVARLMPGELRFVVVQPGPECWSWKNCGALTVRALDFAIFMGPLQVSDIPYSAPIHAHVGSAGA